MTSAILPAIHSSGTPSARAFSAVSHKYVFHFDIHVLRALIKFAVLGEYLIRAAADDAQPQDRHAHFLHHSLCLLGTLVPTNISLLLRAVFMPEKRLVPVRKPYLYHSGRLR